MIAGYPLLTVLFICIGVFIASFMDAIGGGGGIISVPVYLLAGLPVHNALGTNKLSSCLGTAASTFRFIKNGYVNLKLAVGSALLAVAGGHLGTRLQIAVDEKYLKYLLLIVLPIVAIILLKQKKFPEQQGIIGLWAQRLIVWGASFAIGIYDGFYGPGTGTFLLLIFCNFAKMDLKTASGNVKIVNFASNIGAVITSAIAGKVIAPIGLIAAVFSMAGQYIGAELTIKNGAKIVKPVIFTVLFLLTVKIILELSGVM